MRMTGLPWKRCNGCGLRTMCYQSQSRFIIGSPSHGLDADMVERYWPIRLLWSWTVTVNHTHPRLAFLQLISVLHFQSPLQWRHNEHVDVSNHQPHGCLHNCLFKAQIKENVKAPRHWPLCGVQKMFPFDDVIMIVRVCKALWNLWHLSLIWVGKLPI